MNKDSVVELYISVHKELIKNLKELAEPYKFNRGELPVLAKLIKKEDGIPQKEIREDLTISKSTLSKTINSLIKKDFLKKEKDPEDRRVTLIYLTNKGKEIKNIIKEIDQNAEERMMKNFDEKEKEQLSRYLERLLENLE